MYMANIGALVQLELLKLLKMDPILCRGVAPSFQWESVLTQSIWSNQTLIGPSHNSKILPKIRPNFESTCMTHINITNRLS